MGTAVNLILLLILLAFSYLREEPTFWTSAGGLPIWLRDLVGSGYYPLALLVFMLLTAFSLLSAYLLSTRTNSAGLAVLLLPLLWGLFFMAIVSAALNNLDNLLNGRPLHWHPDATWYQR